LGIALTKTAISAKNTTEPRVSNIPFELSDMPVFKN
jgi:hypothetical protein